jgi:hypothetical protein
LRIALQKLQASLSGLLTDASADHDDATLGQSLVAASPDFKGVRKGHGVTNVVRLRLGASRVFVHEDDLAPYALHYESVPGAGAHESAADNANLQTSCFEVHFSPC